MNKNYIAIVGATGLVGRTLIKIFEENNTNNHYVIHLYASENSVGKRIKYKNQSLKVKSLNKPIVISYDFVFLMTEKEISKIVDLTTKYNLEIIRDNFNNNSKVSLLEHLRTYENDNKTLKVK